MCMYVMTCELHGARQVDSGGNLPLIKPPIHLEETDPLFVHPSHRYAD
jgi:hypothetical protein